MNPIARGSPSGTIGWSPMGSSGASGPSGESDRGPGGGGELEITDTRRTDCPIRGALLLPAEATV